MLEVPATRGKITDRQGDVLAVSSPVKSIWAIPEDARLNPSQTRQLAALLEMPVQDLNQKLGVDKGLRLSQAPGFAELADRIAALKLPASTTSANTAVSIQAVA